MAEFDITTRLSRRALAPRREPYWQQLGQGLYLGYRRLATSELGTWVGRWRDPDGKQHHQALGVHEDIHEPRSLCIEWQKRLSLTGHKGSV